MFRPLAAASISILLCCAFMPSGPALADSTVGLMKNEPPRDGYILFSPMAATTTYLISNGGLVINAWDSDYEPGLMAYLLDNGHLLRAAKWDGIDANFQNRSGTSGRLEEYDWNGELVWRFDYSDARHLTHHDFEPLPDGNVIMIAWERVSVANAVNEGRNLALLNGAMLIDCVIEVEPTPPVGGNIVWEWCARDHLIQDFDPSKGNFGIVADHPELIDFNFGGTNSDWIHANGIDYNSDLDQIVISAHGLDEIWVIDHSTTTAEAAGHAGGTSGKGGDLLYRWGNPQVYRRGTVADQQLFGQHDAQWIAAGRPGAGHILVFNNGNGRPAGDYSTVEEIVSPVDENGIYPALLPEESFGPAQPVWSYLADPPTDLFSRNISGAERLPGGTTLVTEGSSGELLEVTSDGSDRVVWEYLNPVMRTGIAQQGETPTNNPIFKARWYSAQFPGLAGRPLMPGDPIELFDRPYPVPEDSVRVAKTSSDGSTLDVAWDAFSCPSGNYILIYGALQDVSTYSFSGAQCDIGLSGSHFWNGVPSGNLFFLVAGTADLGVYESSWGSATMGEERSPAQASFLCGSTTKIVTSSCP